ncbi:MAG: periplasmic heavy metal sensor [Gammaproteobacteria bacterium]|nr:periplasmic heavy metal sensor [Gammaproteobacteria bacterium]NVK87696.1 periplasmic heavy metal sensor [Gammaproteobacteria bacterium]
MNINKALTLILIVATFSGSLFAGHRDGGHQQKRLAFLTEKLELSQAQSEAVKGIMNNAKAEGQSYRENIQQLKQQVKQEMSKASPDKGVVQQLNRQISDQKTELMLIRAQAHKDMKALLNAEQQGKLELLHEMRQEKRQQRRERHEH